MMAAQIKAMSAQSLPPLRQFTGEENPAEDETFEWWLELFEERASVAGWSDEQRLYRLKAHLSGTALSAMCNIPKAQQKTYKLAIAALK